MKALFTAAATALALLPPLAAPAASATGPDSDYRQLREQHYSREPIPIPEGGLSWTVDTASWRLVSGRLWLQRPLSGGPIPGVVFEGDGVFEMAVPDPIELRQFRRFVGVPGLVSLRIDFRRMVLSTSGDDGVNWGPPPRPTAPMPLARDRYRQAGEASLHDPALRLLVASRSPGDRYLRTDLDTEQLGWLSYTFDSSRPEEITLERYHTASRFLESWISLDRPEDRLESGRPRSESRPDTEIEHVDVAADLTRRGKWEGTFKASFEVSMRLRAVRAARLLRFYVAPGVRIRRVEDEAGQALPVLQQLPEERRPERTAFDPLVVVVTPRTLAPGDLTILRFFYTALMHPYAPGRSWYPSPEPPVAGLGDRHTGRLELAVRKPYQLRAMGSRSLEQLEDGVRRAIWDVERPATMLTFSFARRALEYPVTADGVPEVITFGEEAASDTADAFHDIAADVVNSANFFQRLFAKPLEVERIYATLIPASHGQAFDGYLHLSSATAHGDHPGATELFRAHEVAHQWWGNGVGWASYRDQWLSEALSEYSAMLFVEASLPNGSRLFDDILAAYVDEVTGRGRKLFSKFARPGLTIANHAAADRIGPIGLGRRAATVGAPNAFQSLAYSKGALVLHTLRGSLRQQSGSDDTFFDALRAFAAQWWGRQASTEDFQRTLERVSGAEWGWYFDQWIGGAEIPTYLWSFRTRVSEETDGGWVVELEVDQQDVADGFRMPVPVRFDFPGGRTGVLAVEITQATQRFEIPVPERPRAVVFNPDHAVLARVRRR